MAWQDISTLPFDGEQKLFWSPNGGCFIAPAVKARELTVAEKKAVYEHSGDWPNVGWNPTHWQDLPGPPTE